MNLKIIIMPRSPHIVLQLELAAHVRVATSLVHLHRQSTLFGHSCKFSVVGFRRLQPNDSVFQRAWLWGKPERAKESDLR